jgi:hypothetical protein
MTKKYNMFGAEKNKVKLSSSKMVKCPLGVLNSAHFSTKKAKSPISMHKV